MANEFVYAQPVKIWFGEGKFAALSSILEELGVERAVLVCGRHFAAQAQAMTEADIETMREIVSPDMVFTHMSGRQQTREEYFSDVAGGPREEYFSDVAGGLLRYFSIGIENPVIRADNSTASITYTAVLNANAYGAKGTFRMRGTHHWERRDGSWISVDP